MDIGEIATHIEIRALMTTYCRGVDRGDKQMIMSVYHPDGWDVRGPERLSAQDFAGRLVDRMDKGGYIGQHHVTNIHLEIDGEHARSESYVWSLAGDSNNPGRIIAVSGRYLDKLDRRDGRWKISERELILDYAEPQPDGKPWPKINAFRRGGRREGDPSTSFFNGAT